ncbi:MAG: VOC family protein, partial [Ktedonobacterales bacterium]
MLTGLNFVMIHVKDVAAARAFYTEKLGLAVANEQPGFLQFAQPGGQGATFAIGAAENATPVNAGTELWWFTADADAEYA